jgi:hypothetical protein
VMSQVTSTGQKPLCIQCCKPITRDNSLKCANCTFRVHFKCSDLPPYQISNLWSTTRKYTCELCTESRDQRGCMGNPMHVFQKHFRRNVL